MTRIYRNPLIDGDLADPGVIRIGDIWYLYGTGQVDGDNGYRVFTSPDLVHWTRGPVVWQPGIRHVWAPDPWVDPRTGRVYIYYTADFNVGVCAADSPMGPFELVNSFHASAIDGHLFQDADGALYFYYVALPGFRIHVQRMADPVTPQGEPQLVLQPEADWEKRAGHVTEGPSVIRHRSRYYLIYSGSGADTPDYAVGYATASHPMGPFTRGENNPIMHRSNAVFGPGHGCPVKTPAGEWWYVYHQKTTDRVEWDRRICIDRLRFDAERRLWGEATNALYRPAPRMR